MIELDNKNNLLFLIHIIEHLKRKLASITSRASVNNKNDERNNPCVFTSPVDGNSTSPGATNNNGPCNDINNDFLDDADDEGVVGLFRISPKSNHLSELVEATKRYLSQYDADAPINVLDDILVHINSGNSESDDVNKRNKLGRPNSSTSKIQDEMKYEDVDSFLREFETEQGVPVTCHLIANLIKWYLNNLEESLLPFDFCTEILNTKSSSDQNNDSVFKNISYEGYIGEELIIKAIFHHLTRNEQSWSKTNKNVQAPSVSIDILLLILQATTKLIEFLHMVSKDEKYKMTPYNLFVVIFPPLCTSRAKDATKYMVIENDALTTLNRKRRNSTTSGEKPPITKLEHLIQDGDAFASYINDLQQTGTLKRGASAVATRIQKDIIAQRRRIEGKSRWSLFSGFSLKSLFTSSRYKFATSTKRKATSQRLSFPNMASQEMHLVPTPLTPTMPMAQQRQQQQQQSHLQHQLDLQVTNLDDFILKHPSIGSPNKNAVLALRHPRSQHNPTKIDTKLARKRTSPRASV